MRRRLVILALDGLARLLAWLPLPLALNLGKGLGLLTYLLYGSSTVNRIESFLPGQGRRIGRAHLVHLGMLIFESLRAPYRPRDLARIEVRGREHLPTAGGVLLSGHFGNIELLGSVLGRSGHKVADLAWRAEDPLTQFVDQHRRAYCIKFIYTSGSVHARARAFLGGRAARSARVSGKPSGRSELAAGRCGLSGDGGAGGLALLLQCPVQSGDAAFVEEAARFLAEVGEDRALGPSGPVRPP